ncbi:MAG TPA: hypothetical protein VF897_24780 [Roseiflexaceae bacterium]
MLWRRWTSDEIADLQRLYPDPTISTNELKRRFARNYGTIKAMARRLGLRRERIDLWYDVDVAKLVQLYSDEDVPSEQIEATLGRTWRAICHKANQIGLQRPKPNRCGVVRDYFHTIDTAEKAYWLGFIAADGTVDDRPRRYSLTIDLQPRDLHWLQRFRDIIAPGATITQHDQRSYSLSIGSKELVTDIVRLGIRRRKSYNLTWPAVPEQFAITFLLGYFDGDGSFTPRAGRRNYQWLLLGTLDFLWVAREYIQRYVGVEIKEPVRAHKHISPHLYRISANGPRAPIIDRVLNASGLGLPRKHLPPLTADS